MRREYINTETNERIQISKVYDNIENRYLYFRYASSFTYLNKQKESRYKKYEIKTQREIIKDLETV